MMNDALQKRGLSGKYTIDSSATCSFEEGNPTYPKALEKLHEHGVSTYPHYSKPVKKTDYEKFDLFLGMDDQNVAYLKRLFAPDKGNKVKKFLEFSGETRDVADPYYTGDFDATYNDLKRGIDFLINNIENRK